MFETPAFFVVLLATSAVSFALPAGSARARAAMLVLVSLAVLHVVLGLSLLLLACLLAGTQWVRWAALRTRGLAERRPWLALLGVLSPLLVVWILGKHAVAADWAHARPLYFVGVSYLVIEAWTLTKDIHDGRVASPDPAMVAAYFLFFPTYVAGPIHLFGELQETVSLPQPLNGGDVLDVAYRTVLGLVKAKLVVPALTPLSLIQLTKVPAPSTRSFVAACVVYSFVVWLDFSGYSDLAIAASRLMGFKTPENFRNPYSAANIREFWQRWHITFSRVLTSYLFIPITRALTPRLRARQRTLMVLAYLTTFLFCGYWHGPTVNFVIWGLYHGVGLIVYDLYRGWALKRRRLRPPASPIGRLTHLVKRTASAALTFVYVSLGWGFFALPVHSLWRG